MFSYLKEFNLCTYKPNLKNFKNFLEFEDNLNYPVSKVKTRKEFLRKPVPPPSAPITATQFINFSGPLTLNSYSASLSGHELCLELKQTLIPLIVSQLSVTSFLRGFVPLRKIYITSGAGPWKKKTCNCKLKK